ncbi:MAG: hypothetical protein DME21_09530 [Verrucomicrobia bacterium]|nr:MAG: hypothetical protein DME21_09530 [Verrucomicrobiota bacterium]
MERSKLRKDDQEMIYMLQWCSATVATIFLRFLGESVDQDGTVLQLQNVRLDVQPQCCGLNANLALLATAIVAAILFLHRPVPRMILILAAVPLGIIRNGLRICVLAMLCEHIDPRMIHSWVHTHGGPVFFALSLVPLLILLLVLRTSEKQKGEL